MLPKVELNKIRSFGEISDDSILFFKQNWKPLLKAYFSICGFFWVANIIMAVFNQSEVFRLQAEGESIYSVSYFLTMLFVFINMVVLAITGLSFVALYRDKGNVAPTVPEVWSYVKYYILRVFSSSILLLILLLIGTALCFFPGVYLMPVFLLIIAIMVLENGSFSYSFNYAFQLIKGKWWDFFSILLVMSMLILSATVLLVIPVGLVVTILINLTKLNQNHTILIAMAVTFSSLQFLYLLPAIAVALTYYNLNLLNNDNSLLQRIEMIGQSNINDSKQLPSEEY